jgi:hypothetical protein
LANLRRTGLTGLMRWRARLGSASLRLALTHQKSSIWLLTKSLIGEPVLNFFVKIVCTK